MAQQTANIMSFVKEYINFLPPAYVVRREVMFSQVSVCSGGYPIPSHNTSTGPMSFLGGIPVTGSRPLPRGYPSPRQGVPHDGVPPNQVRVGHPPTRDGVPPQPGQDGVPPRAGWGTPPGQVRMVYPVVISACSSLRLNDFPGHLSIRVTIRSVLIVLTVYKAAHSPVQSQKSSGATSTRPLHLRTNGRAVELHHLTTPPEDMAVAIHQ